MGELVNLAVFFGLSAAFHIAQEKLKHKYGNRISSGHAVLVAAAVSHPITWHSLQEYAVHIVIYSGYILPKH